MTPQEFFEKTNWSMLYQQKKALIHAMRYPELLANERWLLEGLLQFLDTAGDIAEEIGWFKYPASKESAL